jgi:REP element-mobilizing transposase RayT
LPGIIHHVISRGIERQNIFRDRIDREEFLRRLKTALEKTDCQCIAWSLMPNHFHLLIRTGRSTLSELMRRLLSGYAIYFNRRYQRHGYLFQNRYKSVLCQEETYLLELVRYIHLNPLRKGIVSNLHSLDRYPWAGHSVLVGKNNNDWQKMDEVLLRFGSKRNAAIANYRKFIKDGMKMGKREDLVGGGLRRSAGGWEKVKILRQSKEYWRGDERILGDSDFVSKVLKTAEETMLKKEKLAKEGWNIERLAEKVSKEFGITKQQLKSKSRSGGLPLARAVLSFLGTNELSIPGVEIARYLGISRPAVSYLVEKGGEYLKNKKVFNFLTPSPKCKYTKDE